MGLRSESCLRLIPDRSEPAVTGDDALLGINRSVAKDYGGVPWGGVDAC
jgi:hypothetical protein